MFVAAGASAEAFCRWALWLGEVAAPLDGTLPPDLALLHVDARVLLGDPAGDDLRAIVEAARRQGALISTDMGDADWIRARGGPRVAYQLAALGPDILFASEAAAAEIGAPLEGVAAVPVVMLGIEGCAVYGRRIMAPPVDHLDVDAFMAAFCVAFVEGAAPVEAAGRAVLVATG